MSIQTRTVTPEQACIDLADVFQDPLLEEGATPRTALQHREWARLQQVARTACLECPMVQQCLYRAVVQHDIAGFCAGTTERQRRQIRHLLDWEVPTENLDDLAGVTAANRQIDPATVARLRAAHPDVSLESLAERLGCSLSTVKRHLRKVRNGSTTPTLTAVRPTTGQVLAAAAMVLGQQLTPARAA